MTEARHTPSGKGARDENFPVASRLVSRANRPVVMRFYTVARMADDIADDPALAAEDKLRRLDAIEAGLDGDDTIHPVAALRRVLAERALSDIPVRDLLRAFRQDAVRSRYADWEDLMAYCRYSAAPVGRFMLDVHREDDAPRSASDALCAALQVINHLQDCGRDYRTMNRVYIPLDALATAEVEVEALGREAASPGLRLVIATLAARTAALLETSAALGGRVRDGRLALEVGVIQTLAEDLTRRLRTRDPLSERVHHRPLEALFLALGGAGRTALDRFDYRRRGRSGA